MTNNVNQNYCAMSNYYSHNLLLEVDSLWPRYINWRHRLVSLTSARRYLSKYNTMKIKMVNSLSGSLKTNN